MPKLSVVLPCYNEEKNLPQILRKYSSIPLDFELILVDNGSSDNTKDVLKKEIPKYKFSRFVTIKKNIGYGFGVMAGLRAAKGEYLSYSHADMQCDPYDIYKGWKILISSEDPENTLVKGNRKGRRNFFTACFHAVATILFLRRFDDINGQPKIFHRNLMKNMKKPPDEYSLDFYIQYKSIKSKFKVVSFPVEFKKRLYGKSSWDFSIVSKIKTISGWVGYLLKLRLFGE